MISRGLAAIAVAVVALTSSPARAEKTCAELIRAGAKVVDTYVMDFGPSDKLYVYILRTRAGAAEKCTSQRPLKTVRR